MREKGELAEGIWDCRVSRGGEERCFGGGVPGRARGPGR